MPILISFFFTESSVALNNAFRCPLTSRMAIDARVWEFPSDSILKVLMNAVIHVERLEENNHDIWGNNRFTIILILVFIIII